MRTSFRATAALACCVAASFSGPAGCAQEPPVALQPATAEAVQPAADEQPTAEPETPPSLLIEIADEPRTIDPAMLVPDRLRQRATAEFAAAPLSEIVLWLRDQQHVPTVLDEQSITEAGLLVSEQITDRLTDQPLYLLLDRLRALDLDWFIEDGVVRITTAERAAAQMATVPYNLGDLLDRGFTTKQLHAALTGSAPSAWEEAGGVGSIVILGDVLFVRHNARMQRKVAGLLTAIGGPARRTYTDDAPENEPLRQKLQARVTASFRGLPLDEAVAQLAAVAGADLRLEPAGLDEVGVRDRTQSTLDVTDQKLEFALDALVSEVRLAWMIRDGVLWITSPSRAESATRTAVFDVRDLCRDGGESDALFAALVQQTAGPWDAAGQSAADYALTFAGPSVLIAQHSERQLDELAALLENYRLALRASKPRAREELDPNEVLVYFYRMPTTMAQDLEQRLPHLVSPDTWQTPERPDAVGTVLRLTSADGPVAANAGQGMGAGPNVPYSVLVVRQTRKTHELVGRLIQRVYVGHSPIDGSLPHGGIPGQGMGGMGGMGGGMGGFGGGFFNVPAAGSGVRND